MYLYVLKVWSVHGIAERYMISCYTGLSYKWTHAGIKVELF